MSLPGRIYNNSSNTYRYGFNNQEKSPEIAENTTTALYWEMDSRICRRWNLDPVPVPWESQYVVERDNPIYNTDPDGDCPNCLTALIGAGAGALIGGGAEIVSQLYHHGSVNNWKAVGGSATQGLVTGAAAGFTGGASLLVTAGVAGGANAIGGAISNKMQGKPVTVISVVTDATVGAFFGAAGKYLGNKAGSIFAKWSKIGSTGKVGEDALKTLGGESQQYFKTTLGGRYVDQLVDDIAHESKVGYTSLTKDIKTQIAKDAELIKNKNVKGAVWHFFVSPKTGKGGATKPLLDELKKNGISFIIHPSK